MEEFYAQLTSGDAQVVWEIISAITIIVAGAALWIAQKSKRALKAIEQNLFFKALSEELPTPRDMEKIMARHHDAMANANIALLAPDSVVAFNRFIASEAALKSHISRVLDELRDADEEKVIDLLGLNQTSASVKEAMLSWLPTWKNIPGLEKLVDKLMIAANNYVKGIAKFGKPANSSSAGQNGDEWGDQSP